MRLTERRLQKIVREEVDKVLGEDTEWDDYPPGWDEESVDKFARSLTGVTKDDPEGFFTQCVDKLEDEEGIDNPEKFCADLKDSYLDREDWRTGPEGD